MKFTSGNRRKPIEYEKDIVLYWKNNDIFNKSIIQRSEDNSYVFYDGPPFITGVPHHGTLLSSVVKDVIPRFWTMQGKRVERVWGWDCHGLPAEVFTEKKLGITDKRDIGTKISLEKYITTCRDNMIQTGDLWEDTIDRIGRWVDFKGAYKTMDKEYMESVWWAFKTLYDKGKIYEGERVLLYCTRDATPISKAEVAMDNSYREVTDPSVYVKFKLKGENSYLLAWTTTPWTLNANTAVAINRDIEYVEVEVVSSGASVSSPSLQGFTLQQGETLQNKGENEKFVLAKNLLEKVLVDEKHKQLEYKVIRSFMGKELVGRSYEPLFKDRGPKAHKIWHADFVTDLDGTGIAHEAPAYGEDDYMLAKENGIPMVLDTDEEGFYTEGPWKGMQIWEHNKQIAKDLKERSIVWKINYMPHEYPHCHRCGTKLQYRAHPSWFMDIDGQKQEMLEKNSNISWFPAHIKHGRFEKTVESAPDWNISRDRFWATAMPVWKGVQKDGKSVVKVIGSYAELEELSGKKLDDYHRPWIDEVKFTIDGVEYERIDKVLDCWFESGSMPFAQFHYPFENKLKFEQNFPGDFIAEYVGQVRAWFYYLHAVNVGIFGENAFKNVIVTGTLAGNDGRKMSKSFGNFTDPNKLMDMYSADALRFLLLSSALMNGEDFSLIDKDVADISRKLSMIWNVYDFFVMYAEVDGWEWNGSREDPINDSNNVLDIWILSKLHNLVDDVEKSTKKYDLQSATRCILPFIDELSNWYIRRSRKRFWKSGNGSDKQMAYRTLHYVLVTLAHILAPFTPFIAEELFRKLTNEESVHLNDWPKAGGVSQIVLDKMDMVRNIVNDGLSLRSKSAIKVRQPLNSITVSGAKLKISDNDIDYSSILIEELNVKKIIFENATTYCISLDTQITDNLKLEGIAREVIRSIQSARKNAGLQIDDRIHLRLSVVDSELDKAIVEHSEAIIREVLASNLFINETQSIKKYDYQVSVDVDGYDLNISLAKVR